jgi:hypothetical protein
MRLSFVLIPIDPRYGLVSEPCIPINSRFAIPLCSRTFAESLVRYLHSIDSHRAEAWCLEPQPGQAGIKKKHRHEGTRGHESTKKRLAEEFRVFLVVFRIFGYKKHEFHY